MSGNELVEQWRIERRDRLSAEADAVISDMVSVVRSESDVSLDDLNKVLTACWDYTVDYRDTRLFNDIMVLEHIVRERRLRTKEK